MQAKAQKLLKCYSDLLVSDPYATKMVTSATLFGIGDMIAQVVRDRQCLRVPARSKRLFLSLPETGRHRQDQGLSVRPHPARRFLVRAGLRCCTAEAR